MNDEYLSYYINNNIIHKIPYIDKYKDQIYKSRQRCKRHGLLLANCGDILCRSCPFYCSNNSLHHYEPFTTLRREYKITLGNCIGLFENMPVYVAQYIYERYVRYIEDSTLISIQDRKNINDLIQVSPSTILININNILQSGSKDDYSLILPPPVFEPNTIDAFLYQYTPVGYLKGMPKDIIKKMLINQVIANNPMDITIFEDNILPTALNGGFTWSSSPDGSKFWQAICKSMYPPIKNLDKVIENKINPPLGVVYPHILLESEPIIDNRYKSMSNNLKINQDEENELFS